MKSKIVIIILSIVFFSCNEEKKTFVPMLELEMTSESLRFNNHSGTQNIAVITNVEFDKWNATLSGNGAAWCHAQKQDAAGVYSLQISVEENKEQLQRTTKVTVKTGDLSKTFDVRQSGSLIEVEQLLYEIPSAAAVFSMEVVANTLIDTIVVADTPWIRVRPSTAEENKAVVSVDENFVYRNRKAEIIFKQRDGELSVTVEVIQKGAGSGYDGPIFTDDVFSELHPEVSEDMILAMEDVFLRNIALAIFNGEYNKEYRVREYYPYLTPVYNRTQYKNTYGYSVLDNPTGIRVTTDPNFTVYVGETYGQTVDLCVIDYRSISFLHSFLNFRYPLKKGVNRINFSPGFIADVGRSYSGSGLVYIVCLTETPDSEKRPVKVHIASGEVNGYFDVQKHKKEDWDRTLNQAKDEYIDLVGKLTHLTFPVQSFKDFTDDPFRLTEVWDSIVWLEERHQGLHKYKYTAPAHTNRMFGHVMYSNQSGGLMHATYHSTGYQDYTAQTMLHSQKLKIDCWGPAHEIGHLNQLVPGFKWDGLGEVSNNLSSMYIKYHFKQPSLLVEWNTYEQALTTFIINGTLYSGDVIDVDYFIKLVPFWQLELYFARVKGNPDFYADLYEHLRKTSNPTTNATAQLNFIKVASDIGETDLSEFFETVKMLTPGGSFNITQAQVNTCKDDIAKHPKPTHKVQYIRDDNLDLFTNNTPITRGSVNTVGGRMVMTGWQGVVAVEQRDASGKVIWATYSFSTPAGFSKHQNATAVYAIGSTGAEELVGNW